MDDLFPEYTRGVFYSHSLHDGHVKANTTLGFSHGKPKKPRCSLTSNADEMPSQFLGLWPPVPIQVAVWKTEDTDHEEDKGDMGYGPIRQHRSRLWRSIPCGHYLLVSGAMPASGIRKKPWALICALIKPISDRLYFEPGLFTLWSLPGYELGNTAPSWEIQHPKCLQLT
jgi:hypothetical protein